MSDGLLCLFGFAGCMGYYGVSGVSDLYRHVSAVLGVGVQVPEPRFRV